MGHFYHPMLNKGTEEPRSNRVNSIHCHKSY